MFKNTADLTAKNVQIDNLAPKSSKLKKYDRIYHTDIKITPPFLIP